MKIAFCTPGSVDHADYRTGNLLGIEFQVFGLAREFVRQKHEVSIFRRWYGGAKEEEIDGVHIVNITSTNLPDESIQKTLTKLLFSKSVAHEMGKKKPDVIIFTEICSAYFLTALPAKKIYVTHNPPVCVMPAPTRFKNYLRSRIENRIFQASDAIVALNNHIKERLESNGYNAIKIPNGVDIADYTLSREKGTFVLFGGRFAKIKSLHTLIAAYSSLTKDLQRQFRLVLVGEGGERGALERLVDTLEMREFIKFLPWQATQEFRKSISKCAVYVLPSLSEVFPVAMLETMALGRTFIASDINGVRDVIVNDENGLLFKTEHVRDLAQLLHQSLTNQDLRKKIGLRARKTVEAHYTFEKIALRYLNMFAELLETPL